METLLKNPFDQRDGLFSIQKVSKELGTPAGTIRQWEKDFNLEIKRDDFNGSRIYSNENIMIFKKIKSYRDKNLNKKSIKDLLIEEGLIKETTNTEIESGEQMNLSNYSLKDLLIELSSSERLIQASDEEYKLFLSLVKNIETIRHSNKDISNILSSLTD